MYIRLFLLVSLTLTSTLPIVNVINSGFPEVSGIKTTIKKLYSLDIIKGYFNEVLFSFGISSNPNQVIVGSDDWLFLGDAHNSTITQFRKGSDSKKEVSQKIIAAQSAWDKYLSNNGIKGFKIIIGPNKSTIYPEKVPHWAKLEGKSISTNLYNSNLYISSIDELIESKTIGQTYFSSDTHWNSFGASVAFKQLIKTLDSNKAFITPSEEWNKIVDITTRGGGDLANFLKAQKLISDLTITTKLNTHAYERFIYDYNSNDLVYQGQDALYGSMTYPYIINTPSALNKSKVLWLSDSFGTAMAPYMTATFTHILKMHWGRVVGTSLLEELVEDWQPDYVIYTVVERSSLSDAFLKYPPVLLETKLELNKIGTISKPKLHSIDSIGHSEYSVSGQDPFLVYDFIDSVQLNSTEEYRLNFDLDCKKPLDFIPIQVFWRSKERSFNAPQSVHFKARNGNNQVILYGLNSINNIVSFRVDLDAVVACNEFNIKDVQIGIPDS